MGVFSHARLSNMTTTQRAFIFPLILVIMGALLVGGYVYIRSQSETSSPTASTIAEITSAPQTSRVTLIGHIDLSEIGGSGLTVHSQNSEVAQADSQGDFKLKLSGVSPQILFVQDNNKDLRGLVVYLSDYPNVLVNAKSTAEASIVHSGGFFADTSDLQKVKSNLKKIEKSVCFPQLSSFLKQKLIFGNLGLSGLNQNEEYTTLVAKCVTEVYR